MSDESAAGSSPSKEYDAALLPLKLDVPIALAVAAFYLLATLLQEKITACHGFGHDGCAYGTWALDFPAHAFDGRLGSYAIQRSFPSLVAWSGLKALHIQPTYATVIRAFQVMNTVLVFVGTLSWTKIARILRIRAVGTLFGTLALFGSYGVLKFTTWYPVLGDLWGYALGFVCLHSYLARRLWVIVPVAMLGAFAWPSLLPPAVLLIFFWDCRSEPAPAPLRLNHVIAGAIAGAWALFTLEIVRRKYWPPTVGAVESMPQVIRLSILVSTAYFYFALRRLADYRDFYRPLFYVRALLKPTGVLALLVLGAVNWAQAKWSVAEPAGFKRWFFDTVILSTLKPGIFALAYAIYFGPLILVLLLRWRDVAARLRAHGAGLVAAAVLATVFGVDSEERHGYTFLALVLPFAVKALDDLHLDRQSIGVLAVLSVAFSKLWLTLPPDLSGASWEFPSQTVFMSQGPWMSNMMYFVQGTVVVLVAVWLHRVMRRSAVGLVAT